MKINIRKYITIVSGTLLLSLNSCNKLIDLQPISEISDASFWKNPDQFRLAANEFYTYLRTFTDILNDGPYHVLREDLFYSTAGVNPYSSGTNAVPNADGNWTTAYTRIRSTNYLLAKAAAYPNPSDIALFVAEARFFRAYVYFTLLQQFGGVPIIDKPLTTTSPELTAPRNSRDEVVDFIIADLEAAIATLPTENNIAAGDKGRVSKGAAQAFLGRVTLYEGTWQKFRSNTARANTLLDKSVSNSGAVISSAQYELFAPAALGTTAYRYLFILENDKSNPAGIVKSANKEYVLANRYDAAQRQIRLNITQGTYDNVYWPTRKFANLFLTQKGLPIDNTASGFQGYATLRSEYAGRDNRMTNDLVMDGQRYWRGSRTLWTGDAADSTSASLNNNAKNSGYANIKWVAERKVNDNEEGYDYPVIRYAEVLLNYAEAVYERNGSISDADLDKSLNLTRTRINKTMPKLSNTFAQANGLDLRTEIRRERTVELYFEGFRRDDLIRWKTAETEMVTNLQGIKWKGTAWETRWKQSNGNSPYPLDSEGNLLLQSASGRKWDQRNYLLPLSTQQIQLNPKLEQNPGW